MSKYIGSRANIISQNDSKFYVSESYKYKDKIYLNEYGWNTRGIFIKTKWYHLKFDKAVNLIPNEGKEKKRKTGDAFLPGIYQRSNKYRGNCFTIS